MKKIELYDILTLSNKVKYTIISKCDYNNKKYAMLVEVNDEEVLVSDEIKIVELSGDNVVVSEIADEKIINDIKVKLSKEALNDLINL